MERKKSLFQAITQEKVSFITFTNVFSLYSIKTFRIEKELLNRPTLPEGTKIITIPTLEMGSVPGTDGESALNQKVVKKSKKKWIFNPVGKSTVRLLTN